MADSLESLMASIARTQPETHIPGHWLFAPLRWFDRLTEPENPFVLRFLLVCAAFFYVAGFVWQEIYFAGCWGCLMFAWPIYEERAKLKRAERLKAYRAQMDAIEAHFRALAREAKLTRRMRAIYGPGADCEGMGI